MRAVLARNFLRQMVRSWHCSSSKPRVRLKSTYVCRSQLKRRSKSHKLHKADRDCFVQDNVPAIVPRGHVSADCPPDARHREIVKLLLGSTTTTWNWFPVNLWRLSNYPCIYFRFPKIPLGGINFIQGTFDPAEKRDRRNI